MPTHPDARDLEAFALKLGTIKIGADSFIVGDAETAGPYVLADIRLAAIQSMLLRIASNIEELDRQRCRAFRDGQLQATVKSAERSNVITISDVLTPEIRSAIDEGRIKVTRVEPKVRRSATAKDLEDIENFLLSEDESP